jgi:hypothetical protein
VLSRRTPTLNRPLRQPRQHRKRRRFPLRRLSRAILSTNCSNPTRRRRWRCHVGAAGGAEAISHEALKAKLAAANAQGGSLLFSRRKRSEFETRKLASTIIIAEQGRWYIAIIRPLLAALVIIYIISGR